MARIAQAAAVAALTVGAAFTAAKPANAQAPHVKTTMVCAYESETGKPDVTDCVGVTVVTRPDAAAAEAAGVVPPFKMHDVSDYKIVVPAARRPAAPAYDPCTCNAQPGVRYGD